MKPEERTMTVEIPAEFAQFVSGAVGRGDFRSESEVVGAALQLLRDRQRRLEELRNEVRPALDRLDRGEGILLDDAGLDEFFDGIESRGAAVWIENGWVCIRLEDDREIRFPAEKNRRLRAATRAQLANVELICGGTGLHWPDLDEDLSVLGIIEGRLGQP
jgi:putative addiction module CopG family antidote